MTKEELLALIEEIPDGSEIFFAVPSGNYWNQIKAVDVSVARVQAVQYSAYLESDQVIEDDRLDDDGETTTYSGQPVRNCYILS